VKWDSAGLRRETPRLNTVELTERLSSLSGKASAFRGLMALFGAIIAGSYLLGRLPDIAPGAGRFVGGLPNFLAIAPFACIPLFIFSGYMLSRYTKEKKRLISANVVRDMLADAFDLISYKPEESISEYHVQESQLRGWKVMQGSDLLRARYKGVSFTFSDLRLETGGRHSRTIFAGQWLIVPLRKAISPPLVVSELAKKGLVNDARSKVQMEDIAFSKKFNVLTEDPHTAFYVLTPHFMEFIVSARQVAQGAKHLCFAGNRAHIALSTGRDSFEPCANVADLRALRRRIQEEIDDIKSIIDEFLLNEGLLEIEQPHGA